MSSVRAGEDWNGTQQDFINKFQETRRSYNNLCQQGAQHTEGLSTQLLNTAVSSVPNLANVLTTQLAARRAAGNSPPISFDEYVQELLEAAQVFDSANSKKSRSRTSTNVHELIIYEDDQEEIMTDITVASHAVDTPVTELMAFQNDQSRRFRPNNRGTSGNKKSGPT